MKNTAKYEAVTYKQMMFGYESDLKLDKYLLVSTNNPNSETAFRFQYSDREEALREAAEFATDPMSRRKKTWYLYAVRLCPHMGLYNPVKASELIAVVQPRKLQVAA